jgi:aminoglycoside phosphotransferase (APT) family kinase protein
MLHEIEAWLARAGFPREAEISTMTPGLGQTELWRISGIGHDGQLVLRLFPIGNERPRDREVQAMGAARTAGLPVPDVIMTSVVADRPAILMTLASGATVTTALGSGRDRARETGRTLGDVLGRINLLPAPEGLAPADAWLDRAGPELAPLRDRLIDLPNANRLLHLDFHPENVLMENGEVTAVIDWPNTLPGPPHIDLGRSRAILQMVRTLPRLSPEVAAAVDVFEAGLVEGHERLHGPDPDPDLTLAWGVGTQCVDFTPQIQNPGSWVTAELVDHLKAKRDTLIAGLLDQAGGSG